MAPDNRPAAAPPATIPLPPTFPVTWDDPDDAQLFWQQERMHFPEPTTPMTESVWAHVLDAFTRAWASYETGIQFKGCRINTYHYETIVAVEVPPGDQEAQATRTEAKLAAAMARLADAWATEQLPEITQHLQAWERFDLRGASDSALLGHASATLSRVDRLWELHDQIVLPALLAMSLFEELYQDVVGSERSADAYQMLQGFDNKTLETDRVLWQLSRKARDARTVREVLETHAAERVMPLLQGSAEGRTFLSELHAFLRAYGQRSERLELSLPRWIEEPAPVIRHLQTLLAQPDEDPAATLAALASAREQAVAQARARLQAAPPSVVSRFEVLLKGAQAGTVLSEEHGYWIDVCSMYQVRRVLVELGRRLVDAGALDSPDDVFYLTLDELPRRAEDLPSVDRRLTVAGRRAELAYFRTMQPPLELGTPPDGPPPDDAVSRTIEKFFGTPPAATRGSGVVRGHAGSPGVVRGHARVIRSLVEAQTLQPGDILVTDTTSPAWTPLFATVAAVVTDTGGVLSHCAVVAREYRIPAVVGTGDATTRITDGQIVEVDGSAGTIRIVSPA